jgi:tRNA-dihydrouridine synthase A
MSQHPPHRFSVAPMMSQRALLYTEMVTAPAVIHGDRDYLLGFSDVEYPVALQLGGSDPVQLAQAAKIGEAYGYDEINLNVGCPSDRVQSGRFGACLMREPELVAECMAAIKEAVSVPATVKCRIGVDDQDPNVSLFATVDACANVGIDSFIVHARKAWLKGLSPKENRDVPPLDYDLVRRLKRERPHLTISINGGIGTLDQAEALLEPDEHGVVLDGVMLGRAAYHEPALMGQVDRRIFGEAVADIDPYQALENYRPYMQARLDQGFNLASMTRHMMGLMHGRPGARAFRRIMTVEGVKAGAGLEVLDRAIEAVREAEAAKAAAA